jgi:transcriptional regulator CtsR
MYRNCLTPARGTFFVIVIFIAFGNTSCYNNNRQRRSISFDERRFFMRLSDSIEQFIKTMLAQEEQEVELKRNELAEYFGCAPSQINYVLATRFTPDHGYIIESRRGGGGYIRIFRMQQDTGKQLVYLLNERIGDSISALSANHLIQQLQDREIVTANEAALMTAAVSAQSLSLPLPEALKDALRAKILKSMLMEAARKVR